MRRNVTLVANMDDAVSGSMHRSYRPAAGRFIRSVVTWKTVPMPAPSVCLAG